MKLAKLSFLFAPLFFGLTGCGGSDNSQSINDNTSQSQGNQTDNTDNQSSQDENPTWQAGVYPNSSEFANRCANPRVGVDPYEQTDYPDTQGSILTEQLFLRAFSHETYLWYDELPDNDPADFSTVAAYFAQLKTNATTDSGRAKDQYHFSRTYEEYMQETQSGTTGGYGFNWAFLQSSPPRNLVIAYVDDASPAATKQITRGDKLVKVNNIDVINTTVQAEMDALNQALFSPELGASFDFTFESAQGQTKTVNLAASEVVISPVRQSQVIEFDDKKVGYVQFNQFIPSAQQGLVDSFRQFADAEVDHLILDMRYNGGGLLYQSAQLGYMIAGAQSRNRAFETLTHNDKRNKENVDIPFVEQEIDWQAYTLTDQQLPTLNLDHVYILSSYNTASASESLINGLRGIDVEVFLIGDQTRGKPYGFVPEQNCGMVYYTIQTKGANEKGFGDYADGFIPTAPQNIEYETGLSAKVPGCQSADDFSSPLGNRQEGMLSNALNHIQNQSCIPVLNGSLRGQRWDQTQQALSVSPVFNPLKQATIYTEIKSLP